MNFLHSVYDTEDEDSDDIEADILQAHKKPMPSEKKKSKTCAIL